MKMLMAAGAFALISMASAAQAAPNPVTPQITFVANGTTTQPGTTVIQNFDLLPAGTSLGTNAAVYNMSVPYQAERPNGSLGNFAAVLANGSYTFTSPVATAMFSFLLGSLDTYNTLMLTFTDGSTSMFTDGMINGGNAIKQGVVTYSVNSGPLISSATFSATGNAFEFDNIAVAVPEPAAWGMMILGFGLVGGALRRRSAPKVKFA